MKKIGITGGIGTGKTTVAKIFNLLGIPIYMADHQAKLLTEQDQQLKTSIISLLGEKAYQGSKYNTSYVAQQVFQNKQLLEDLNKLIHPAVQSHFENWCLLQNSAFILKEAALLFETGSYKSLDYTIVVESPLELRLQRIRQRDPHRSESDILKIIDKQMSQKEKIALADELILNDETQLLIPQVLRLYQKFSS